MDCKAADPWRLTDAENVWEAPYHGLYPGSVTLCWLCQGTWRGQLSAPGRDPTGLPLHGGGSWELWSHMKFWCHRGVHSCVLSRERAVGFVSHWVT